MYVEESQAVPFLGGGLFGKWPRGCKCRSLLFQIVILCELFV